MSIVALAAVGCGDDDEETVTETTTVIETTAIPRPETVPPATTEEPTETEQGTTAEEDSEDDSDDDSGAISAPAHCGRIAFEKNTDSGAIAITAVGVDCATAKAVAQAAQGRTRNLSFEANGFECRGIRRSEAALASVDWTCLRGADFIRFGTT